MLGLRFGRLFVKSETSQYIHPSGQPARQFVATCDCGKIIVTRGSSLRNGTTKSCGCYHSDEVRNRLQHTDHPDMVGSRFGRLMVQRRATKEEAKGRGNYRWYVVSCDCGSPPRVIAGYVLRRGSVVSCGCYAIERSTKHGGARHGQRSAEYGIWCGLIKRCENTNGPDFADYGGRGITVCRRWRKSYPNFLEDMGARPSPQHSIDRINNNKGYSPSNCQWATPTQQARNRRKRRLAT